MLVEIEVALTYVIHDSMHALGAIGALVVDDVQYPIDCAHVISKAAET